MAATGPHVGQIVHFHPPRRNRPVICEVIDVGHIEACRRGQRLLTLEVTEMSACRCYLPGDHMRRYDRDDDIEPAGRCGHRCPYPHHEKE